MNNWVKDFHNYVANRELTEKYKSKKIILEDVGNRYRLDATPVQRICKKIVCAALSLLFFVSALTAGMQNIQANKGYAAIPFIAALLSGIYCLLGIINLLVSRQEMTEHEYKEYAKQIKRGSTWSLCAMGVVALVHLIFLAISLTDGGTRQMLGNEFLAFGCTCICCGCAGGIRWAEKRFPYIILPSKQMKPENDEPKGDNGNLRAFPDFSDTKK